jgi:NADH-quinone oxidoreductase subunit D
MADFLVEEHVQGKHMVLNMGPQHPSTHGVLRVVLELDGERVIKCVPHIGYLHTGIEKLSEYHNYTKNITHYCRMDYLAPMNNELAYCLAVEKLIGEEVPQRASYIRVVMHELTRIISHFVWIGSHAIDMGAGSVLLYAFGEREKIIDFYEMVGGQRMMTSYIRIGGVKEDLPQGFDEKVRAWAKPCLKTIAMIDGLLTKNPIWRKRTQNVGVLDKQTALSYSVLGPMLRASGVEADMRKDEPYCRFEEFDFEAPVRPEGDVYARYEVRMEEMRQSVKLVLQGLDKIKQTQPGTVMWDNPHFAPPKRQNVDKDIEGLIHHFKYWTEGIKPPAGEAYGAVESSKGELGFYVVSDGTANPVRVKVRGPSFVNLATLPVLCEGRLIADVVACIGTIDIVLGEVDR